MTIQTPPEIPASKRLLKRRIFTFGIAGGLFLLGLCALAGLLFTGYLARPHAAPETEQVLSAQASLPFQVLVPAFLPGGFDRSKVRIEPALISPTGEAMIRLTYSTWTGDTVELTEWLAQNPDLGRPSADLPASTRPQVVRYQCLCLTPTRCELIGMEVALGQVHIALKTSVTGLLSLQEIQLVISTLGPAANRQVYTSIQDVPASYSLPPAVAVPVNAQGVQELTLVVTPEGYNPLHFSVKRGVPVRLVFRQYGDVGCGNELAFTWGEGKNVDLVLTSPNDQKIIEFTPEQTGDFPYHCPHDIYRGAMTVDE